MAGPAAAPGRRVVQHVRTQLLGMLAHVQVEALQPARPSRRTPPRGVVHRRTTLLLLHCLLPRHARYKYAQCSVKPPDKRKDITPVEGFADYLLKVNFSEEVRYDRDDRLAELDHFLIANFL